MDKTLFLMDQEEKKRRKLIKAQIKDGTYVDPNLKSNVDFIRPEGMSDEEYTRKIVEMEAKTPFVAPPSKSTPSRIVYKSSKPQIKKGPRGGRYTEDKTKDGRPYRRYF